MESTRTDPRALTKSPWTVILCAALIVTLSMGIRQAFGLIAAGLALWHSEGAMIWLQQIISYCL